MSKHVKFRLIVVFVGIKLYINHLDSEVEKNINEIHKLEDQVKPSHQG